MKFSLVVIVRFLFLCNVLIFAEEELDLLTPELQLTDMDLVEFCEELSNYSKMSFRNTSALPLKMKSQNEYGGFLRSQAERMRKFKDIPSDIFRNWSIISKPGDVEMGAADYGELVVFSNTLENIILHDNSSSTNQDQTVDAAKATWEKKVASVSGYVKDFPNFFNLTKKAAKASGDDDVLKYWENLSEVVDMYSKLQTLWEEVNPLYTKLHSFVKKRLFNHYKLDDNNSTEIPVYLLGSDFGEDWSDVAQIVLPHPQLYHDVLTEIQHKTVKRIYKLAENMTKSLGLSGLGKGFWRNSTFNSTNCNTLLFIYCHEQFTEVSTCSNISWKSYLKAHEVAMEIALNNVDYDSLPRRNLRFSAIDEAITGLSSILAVNNLPLHGILEPDALKVKDENYNQRMTSLLLIALKVLPKLAYYVAAETWRTEMIQNENGFVNLGEEWWKKRNEIQGVEGVTNSEPDYLRDLYITKNRPYLSKILGIFLQFQLYDYYYKSQLDPDQNLASSIGEDVNFGIFLKERPARDWLSLVTYYFEISEISSASLLEYFEPLEQYLDNAPEKQEPFRRKPPKKVELSDDDYSETTTKKTKKNKTKGDLKVNPSPPALEDDLSNYGPATDQNKEENGEGKSFIKHKNASKEGSERVSESDDGDVQNDQGKKDGDTSDPESKEVQGKRAKYATDLSQTIGTYIGIAVIACSVVTISAVLIRQKIKRKKRSNNRRFET